jgi:hypothetical protein
MGGASGRTRTEADLSPGAPPAAPPAGCRRSASRGTTFDISRYGREASQAAWLIVQHSDHDRAWQAAMLEALTPRVARGDMQGNYYAYLVDRVAVNSGRPQTYGTQGRCFGPGDWRPLPLADEANLDRLRAEIGLEPIAAYRARFTCQTAH